MEQTNTYDPIYMERAINLARLGLHNVSPNPHVGAVIVHNGRIIGEGFHRRYGEAHAEVNAINSVRSEDVPLLPDSTIYVTLEPCSHYGKTPPCSKLIIDRGIKHVVVGCTDPNPKVDGGGIAMMRNAGIKVDILEGEIAERCRQLDRAFMSKFINGRPFITLKWAMSADGYMANADGSPHSFSTPLTQTLVHQLRGNHDVILTSAATVIADNPMLDCRLWKAGRTPQPAIIDRSNMLPDDCRLMTDPDRIPIIYRSSIEDAIADLGDRCYNSVLVEAGPRMLQSFIDAGLWDSIRVEVSPERLSSNGGFKAPVLPEMPSSTETIDQNKIITIERSPSRLS